MNTRKIRATFTKSHAQLRKARREYLDAHRHAILQSRGNALMHATALEMVELGLYAKPAWTLESDKSFKDFRFSIARAIWQIEKSIWGKDAVGEWFFWLTRNSFDLSFGRNLKPQQKRA